MELRALIGQDLVWLTVLVDAVLQEPHGVFVCGVVVDLAAWNVSAVIIQVAYHPFIVIGHFEV